MVDQKTDFTELSRFLQDVYEEKIPFNKELGLKIISLKEDNVCIKLEMKEKLVGNYKYGMLHGGVISSVLDATGGAIVSVGILKKMVGCRLEEIFNQITKISTVDLRVDFLRPGQGNYFLSTGSIMRMGNKVVVIRTTLHNDKEALIAVGTGIYMLG
ncbi:MAG: thioesterase family protein [Thermodesulfobacteriota bacterium]|nr:thioesterase family protein [Thermodesulfobacteriota bacterium]